VAEHALVLLTPPSLVSPPPQQLTTASTVTPPPPQLLALSALRVSPNKLSLTGRLVNRRCIKPTSKNREDKPCRRPVAVNLTYTLNLAARVTLTIATRLPGRSVGGRCVTPTSKNQKHKPCTRAIALPGSVSDSNTAGSNTFTFTGRIGGRTLGPGSYLLSVTPTAGGQSGTPHTVAITLVK
jgi:hypothetical protein